LRRAVRHSEARGFQTRLDDYRKFSVTSESLTRKVALGEEKIAKKIDGLIGG
jgi:hypothetical protein